jgi:hypothetical protein
MRLFLATNVVNGPRAVQMAAAIPRAKGLLRYWN